MLNAYRNSASVTSDPEQLVEEISAEALLSLCGSELGMLSPDGICKPFRCQTQISLLWSCVKWDFSQFGNWKLWQFFLETGKFNTLPKPSSFLKVSRLWCLCFVWVLFFGFFFFWESRTSEYVTLELGFFGSVCVGGGGGGVFLTWTTKQLYDFAGNFPKFSLRQTPIGKFPWPN